MTITVASYGKNLLGLLDSGMMPPYRLSHGGRLWQWSIGSLVSVPALVSWSLRAVVSSAMKADVG